VLSPSAHTVGDSCNEAPTSSATTDLRTHDIGRSVLRDETRVVAEHAVVAHERRTEEHVLGEAAARRDESSRMFGRLIRGGRGNGSGRRRTVAVRRRSFVRRATLGRRLLRLRSSSGMDRSIVGFEHGRGVRVQAAADDGAHNQSATVEQCRRTH
jgi:hypothetical protein